MAFRPAWRYSNGIIERKSFGFKFNSGFSTVQKQKNIIALHEAIGEKTLEISTKSFEEFGKRLSAFNLKLDGVPLECVFQASKVYENGGPYLDLLKVSPKEAKTDERHHTSGRLIGFRYGSQEFPLEPKTVFYDFIYSKAVFQNFTLEELKQLNEYSWFTDIEYNPAKSINCQAEAVCVVKAFIDKFGDIPDLSCENSLDEFIKFHRLFVRTGV